MMVSGLAILTIFVLGVASPYAPGSAGWGEIAWATRPGIIEFAFGLLLIGIARALGKRSSHSR